MNILLVRSSGMSHFLKMADRVAQNLRARGDVSVHVLVQKNARAQAAAALQLNVEAWHAYPEDRFRYATLSRDHLNDLRSVQFDEAYVPVNHPAAVGYFEMFRFLSAVSPRVIHLYLPDGRFRRFRWSAFLAAAALWRLSSPLRPLAVRLRDCLYNNTLNLRVNLVFSIHLGLCRLARVMRGSDLSRIPNLDVDVAALRRDRIRLLPEEIPRETLERVRAKVRDLMDRPDRTDTPSDMKGFLTYVVGWARELPEVAELITPRIRAILERFYGAHFNVYSIVIYRTHPTAEPPKSSWLWHSDDHPDPVMKVMVYLEDTTAANGAFRAFPMPITRELRAKGFKTRMDVGGAAEDLNDMSRSTVYEGKAGTALIFDNNLIHRATAPETGYRDAVIFQVQPAFKPAGPELRDQLDRLSKNLGFPQNPFRARRVDVVSVM